MNVYMQYKKDTKNTYVFEEVDDTGTPAFDPIAQIPTLYIRKSAFKGEEVPRNISVSVNPA